MIFVQIKADRMENFSYIIGDEDTKEAVIVDPSYNAEKIIPIIEREGLKVKYIINTHSHGDHIYGNQSVADRFGAQIVAHRKATVDKQISVDEGDVLAFGRVKIKVLYTPGHTFDGICLLVDGKLLTGDTLFVGECGHTKRGSSALLYQSLMGKLKKLDDDIEVWPGHDYGDKQHSTIGWEKKTNYTLEERTLDEFIEFMEEE
jgi:glyoxylase-like metal-dependent hydrolase (beta-lactamase superfamily II)